MVVGTNTDTIRDFDLRREMPDILRIKIEQKVANKEYILEHKEENIEKAKELGIYHVWALLDPAEDSKLRNDVIQSMNVPLKLLEDEILSANIALGLTCGCNIEDMSEVFSKHTKTTITKEDLNIFAHYFWSSSEMKLSDWQYYISCTDSKLWMKAINKSVDYVSHYLKLPVSIDPVWRVERIFLDSYENWQLSSDNKDAPNASMWWKIIKESADYLKNNKTPTSSVFKMFEQIEYKHIDNPDIIDIKDVKEEIVTGNDTKKDQSN